MVGEGEGGFQMERDPSLAFGAGDEIGVTVDVEAGTVVMSRNGEEVL